jgi:hypothetical protein
MVALATSFACIPSSSKLPEVIQSVGEWGLPGIFTWLAPWFPISLTQVPANATITNLPMQTYLARAFHIK